MVKVEPGCCWDDVVNGATGDEKFDDILGILDFPLECLGDDEFVGEWDASKSSCLGPIPSDVLMGPPIVPKIDTGPSPRPVAQIDKTPEPKLPPYQFEDRLVQEPTVFQIQSPDSVLESNGSHSTQKSLLTNSHITIPVGTRSNRVRPSAEPWFLRSPFFTTSKKTYDAKKNKERRTKLSMKDSFRKAKNIFEESNSVVNLQNASATQKCTHCEITKTPQWREGPEGPKTLCNACGVRYRSGRLFPEYRPAASPTFVPSLHSNSHKKVIEMRNKGKQKASEVEVTPMSPDMEFIPMSSYLFDSM